MRRLALCAVLMLVCLLAQPLHAATVPSLSIWSQNAGGTDLLVGGRVLVVIELRADEPQQLTLSHSAPAGLFLESAQSSSGAIAVFDVFPPSAPPPGLLWSGEVSAAQPINVAIIYSVMSGAEVGDRTLSASGQAAGVPIAAAATLRICCVVQPPPDRPGEQNYLPLIHR